MSPQEVMELEANRFAMELLMPFEFLRRDIAEMDDLDLEGGEGVKRLAKRYKVSEQVMAVRLGQLGFLP